MATLIVSDVHLGAVPPENERAFLAFLARVPEQSDHLVINGDLFDFWFEYASVVPRGHFQALRRLAGVVEAGVKVSMIGGNHDAWGGDFLSREVGLDLRDPGLSGELEGWRVRVEHGDGQGAGDWGYRMLRRVTRSRMARGAFRWLHPDVGSRLARRASSTERKLGYDGIADTRQADRLRDHATRVLEGEAGLELVAFGHAHQPELSEIAPGRFYLNTGDWIEHLTYARLSASEVRLERWPAAEILGSGRRHPGTG